MAAEPKVIEVEPGSELDSIMEEATKVTVILEGKGRRFRLVREEVADPMARYDPERARAALKRVAGMFAGIDTAALKAELREQRGQDSQGRPGW